MNLIRNNIPIQNKSMGDQISFTEWNKVVNQLSTQANMLTNVAENVIENYFDFVWLPNNETPTPNGIDIIIIPDNSLGDLVTDEETLANYFNKENSQYPPTEWKYSIIKYKRGTRVLEILSTGVMKFSQEKLEDLINSNLTLLDTKLDIVKGDITNIKNDVSQLDSTKQNKLIAGENITIDPNTDVISASSGNSYEPDGVTIVLNEDDKLKVSKDLEIDGGFL